MKYNIVEIGNEEFVLASCSTLKMAQRYLKEMYKTDKELQKYYGWSRTPEYKIIESEED